jgi:hypothetical protein
VDDLAKSLGWDDETIPPEQECVRLLSTSNCACAKITRKRLDSHETKDHSVPRLFWWLGFNHEEGALYDKVQEVPALRNDHYHFG